MKNCYQCLKFSVAVMNSLIMVLGVAILGLSIWLHFEIKTLPDNSSPITYAIYFLIGFGAFMSVIGFLGFCGALHESQAMLGLNFIMVLLMWVVLSGAGAWTYKNFDLVQTWFQDSMHDYLSNYKKSSAVKASIDAMQTKFQCCGANGIANWDEIIPPSCCAKNSVAAGKCDRHLAYKEGCAEKIFDWIKDNETAILVVTCSISAVLMLDFLFNIILCAVLRKLDYYY